MSKPTSRFCQALLFMLQLPCITVVLLAPSTDAIPLMPGVLKKPPPNAFSTVTNTDLNPLPLAVVLGTTWWEAGDSKKKLSTTFADGFVRPSATKNPHNF